MTLVRRTAQLISDLKLLNMIKEKDKIRCTFIEEGIYLRIDFNKLKSKTDINSIKLSIEKEFEDMHISKCGSDHSTIYIKVYIHKDKITDSKLMKVYGATGY